MRASWFRLSHRERRRPRVIYPVNGALARPFGPCLLTPSRAEPSRPGAVISGSFPYRSAEVYEAWPFGLGPVH